VPRIVAIHGIGQQREAEDTLHASWLPAMRGGLRLAGDDTLADADLRCAFYGDLFRPPGTKAVGEPAYGPADVDPEWELELLLALWEEAARVEDGVAGPDAERVKARTPRAVQAALRALSNSRFFSGLAERAMIADLKQVRAYVRDTDTRGRIRQRVTEAIGPDTTVLVGHSLGSVVAYEVAALTPAVRTLVTLGSPLGIRHLIFEHLEPVPHDGRGVWPGAVARWTNIADTGDVVALVKALATRFGDRVEDHLVDNGATAHNIKPYLTARETGAAIAAGLAE
jgi:hypothetical protein